MLDLHWVKWSLYFPHGKYALDKSSKMYIMYIWRIFQKGLITDKLYPFFIERIK